MEKFLQSSLENGWFCRWYQTLLHFWLIFLAGGGPNRKLTIGYGQIASKAKKFRLGKGCCSTTNRSALQYYFPHCVLLLHWKGKRENVDVPFHPSLIIPLLCRTFARWSALLVVVGMSSWPPDAQICARLANHHPSRFGLKRKGNFGGQNWACGSLGNLMWNFLACYAVTWVKHYFLRHDVMLSEEM